MKRALCVCLCCLLVNVPIVVNAEAPALEVTDAQPVKANLEKLVGKPVTLKLSSGEELGGIVKKVGPEAVQISELTGREFFDAVIPLEKIVALIVRTRTS
ncbi:MAG: hypothetical protein KDD64_04110 [Bdellovibrionales bacterium]|nr:hypothetical protein [Bdellovibrionales bacterium]